MSIPHEKVEKILDVYRQEYIADLPEKFSELEGLISAVKSEDDEEVSGLIFRNVHSIKGTSSTFELPFIAEICHQMEETLEHLNKNASSILINYVDLLNKALSMYEKSENPDFSQLERSLYNLRKRLSKNKYLGIVVDPSRLHTSMVQKILDPYPVQITTMNDGLAALSRMLFVKYDFIITSRELPSLNGIALIAAIKNSNCLNNNIQSIILSSQSDANYTVENTSPDHIIIKDKSLNETLPSTITSIFTTLDN